MRRGEKSDLEYIVFGKDDGDFLHDFCILRSARVNCTFGSMYCRQHHAWVSRGSKEEWEKSVSLCCPLNNYYLLTNYYLLINLAWTICNNPTYIHSQNYYYYQLKILWFFFTYFLWKIIYQTWNPPGFGFWIGHETMNDIFLVSLY